MHFDFKFLEMVFLLCFLCVESDRFDDRKRDLFGAILNVRLIVSMCVVLRFVLHCHCRDLIGRRRRHIWHSLVQFGWTALILAAREGHADCARLLVDAGADKEAKNEVCDS